MGDQVYYFDNEIVEAALAAAQDHYGGDAGAVVESDVENGRLCMAGGCISVTVENGRICVNLPLGFGKYCLPIPGIIPNGTAAEMCLQIYTLWGASTGVKVTIYIVRQAMVSKSFGKC